jgi:hypothetical protein
VGAAGYNVEFIPALRGAAAPRCAASNSENRYFGQNFGLWANVEIERRPLKIF